MIGPANENGSDGTNVTWRVRLSDAWELAVSEPCVSFELVDSETSILACFVIPTETLNSLLHTHLSTFVEMQLDGSINIEPELSDGLVTLEPPGDILQLVREGLSPEMLEDEPDLLNQLLTLRQRLADSLALVDKALTDLGS